MTTQTGKNGIPYAISRKYEPTTKQIARSRKRGVDGIDIKEPKTWYNNNKNGGNHQYDVITKK